MYQNRDTGIQRIEARRNHCCYGMGLGIILLDDVYPGFPGDVRNASGYPFPIQYEIAEAVDSAALVIEEDKTPCLEPVRRAAEKLEYMGCRAIAAECGYFACFQTDIAAHVDVPVFMSSLLQVPWAQRLIGPRKMVGILAASKEYLTEEHLEEMRIDLDSGYVVGGLGIEGGEGHGTVVELEHLWSEINRANPPRAHYEKAEREFVAAASRFYKEHPAMGAMVLECTGFQPFARALQREIDIPIFSWGTLLDYAYSVVVHRDYYGHV